MKKQQLISIFIVAILLSCAVYFVYASGNLTRGDEDMAEEIYTTLPNGTVATFKEYDRDLTLTDFCQVKVGSQFKEVVDLFGKPNGVAGSGVSWPYYQLSDGTFIILHCFSYENDETAQIFDIRILDMSGRVFALKPMDETTE